MKLATLARAGATAVVCAALLIGCSGNPSGGSTTNGTTTGGGTTASGPNTKNIGALDQEAIYSLQQFQDVKKQLDDLAKKAEEDWAKKWKGKENTREAMVDLQESRAKLNKAGLEKMNPLKRKAEAAIAQVSRSSKMVVVLDKRIVVYGVPDITDEVKKTFESAGEIKLPDEVDTSKSPIGYFDQQVVRSLRVFQELDQRLYKKKMELMKEFQTKVEKGKLGPQETEMLQQEYKLKMDTFQESLTAPLLAQVNEAVQEVAKAQGLSLVLDKQHVMQGGRNMTNEVVEAFLKKVGGSQTKPAASATPGGAKPTPEATP